MELVKGVKQTETLELEELLTEEVQGRTVKVTGAVHTIRDMGNVAFLILRKRGGLVQCVYEKGVSGFDLKDVKKQHAWKLQAQLQSRRKRLTGLRSACRESVS